jgi:hypothetical protein
MTELKRAFERRLSKLVRKRQAPESSSEARGGPLAGHQPVAKHPQPEPSQYDSLSQASVFCMPKFRRDSDGTPTPLRDKISIFEGLVKPSSPSPSDTVSREENSSTKPNGASTLTEDKLASKPTSRLPSKYGRGAAKTNAHRHGHCIAGSDPSNFFRRLSSTFRYKHKSSRQHVAGSRGSRAGGGFEKETFQNGSQGSQSTPRSQKLIHIDTRHMLAADSLRRRLESELRSVADTKGHRDVQTDRLACDKHREPPASQNESSHPIAQKRRKTTLWDIENPFDLPKTKDRCKSDTAGGIHPAQSITSGTMGYGCDDLVVVANAGCGLTHPRPSRSSDRNMIRVLCKCGRETGEGQGQRSGGRESLVSVSVSDSEGSTYSFYTAPVSTSV